jgi:putative transposase
LSTPTGAAQFISEAFTDTGLAKGILLSMHGKGSWRGNGFVERLWRSVKYEEIYLKAYESVRQARRSIADYPT